MKFEHFALNVRNPKAITAWYEEHCGMKAVIDNEAPPSAKFIADSTGRMTWEIYENPVAELPEYSKKHHLEYHLAFAVTDAEAEKERLIAAGATFIELVSPPDGSKLIMMRDPFGLALQLCQRANPFD